LRAVGEAPLTVDTVSDPDAVHSTAAAADGSGAAPRSDRRDAVDVVRALALWGVVTMNYHGYLHRGDDGADTSAAEAVFHPFSGLLTTRFAATMTVVVGISAALFLAGGERGERGERRWQLVRRGAVLWAFGYSLNWVWDGTILFYLGPLLIAAAVMCRWRTAALVSVAGVAAAAAAVLAWWNAGVAPRWLGEPPRWLTPGASSSYRDLALDTAVYGTHPVLPWIVFVVAGVVIGRNLDKTLGHPKRLALWGAVLVGGGYALSAALAGVDDSLARFASQHTPFERQLPHTATALGAALLLVAGSVAGTNWAARANGRLGQAVRVPVRVLAGAGRWSLSVYLAHIVVFKVVVDDLGWVGPTGLGTSLVFAAVVWVALILVAGALDVRGRTGPAERLYRRLAG
jgi:uncharacterized protein